MEAIHVIGITLLGDNPRVEFVKSNHSHSVIKAIIRYDIDSIRYCRGEDVFQENGCKDENMMDKSYDFFCGLVGINIKDKAIIIDRIVTVDPGDCEHF
jgi:hypothetical protein